MVEGNPPPARWLDEAEERAWWALLEVGSGLFDLLTHNLKVLGGLTVDDFEVLHLLSQQPDRRLRVGDLADQLLTGRTRLSQRVDRLTERGWVRREQCPDDRRARHVVLTDDGMSFLEQLAPLHLEHVRTNVFDLLDRADVEALGVSLSKIAQHLHDLRRRTTCREGDESAGASTDCCEASVGDCDEPTERT